MIKVIILLVGDSKTGKSVSSATFPKPLLYLDYDNGFLSVKHAKDKSNNLIVPDFNKCDVIPFYKDGYVNLNFKTANEADFKRPTAPSHTQFSQQIVNKSSEVFTKLYNDKGMYNEKQYQTLVIDSLTSVFRSWKETILFINSIPQLRMQDYQTLDNVLFNQYIPMLKALQQYIPYIILIDHEQMDKDELSGRIMEFPIGPSQNMGRNLGKEFDEIWRQKVEGDKYVWRTRKDGLFQAGSRLHLPDPIEANFSNLKLFLDIPKLEVAPKQSTGL